MKILVVLIILFLSTIVRGEDIVYAGLMKEEINQSGVAEIGARVNVSEHVLSSFSLMWFAHEDNVYDGVNASIGVALGSDLKLYTGLGGFVGEYEACSIPEDGYEEECESHYTGGLYPELALQMSIYKFRLATYARYYRTFDAGNNEYRMFGIFIGYEL